MDNKISNQDMDDIFELDLSEIGDLDELLGEQEVLLDENVPVRIIPVENEYNLTFVEVTDVNRIKLDLDISLLNQMIVYPMKLPVKRNDRLAILLQKYGYREESIPISELPTDVTLSALILNMYLAQ